MIDRRDFANALALGLLDAPFIAAAQSAQRLPVVGTLTAGPQGKAFRLLVKGLNEAGYVEGRNFRFESRFTEGNPATLPGFAADLAKLKVDVIYAVGPAAVKAARDASKLIPIVAIDLESDPVQSGWARSFARPGGNLTGLFLDVPALAGKWLELMRAAAPGIRRIGLLWDPGTGSAQLVAAKAAAQGLGFEIQVMEVRRADGIEPALKAGIGAGIKGVVVLGSPMMDGLVNPKVIADVSAQTRLPAISPFRSFPDLGGLMSYGPDLEDFQPRAGGFVVRILKGEKPGDMAIELPTKFELVINLKTARALGLTIPQALRLRADELIE